MGRLAPRGSNGSACFWTGRGGAGAFAFDYARGSIILDEPGTYDFKAIYCDRPGDANSILESNVWTVEVEPPERHRNAFEAYTKELARFAGWPVREQPTSEIIDRAFDFVERFPNGPWAKPLRRMLLAQVSKRWEEATSLQLAGRERPMDLRVPLAVAFPARPFARR